jgi:hypothetical protein
MEGIAAKPPAVCGDVGVIFQNLSDLYHLLIECFEDAGDDPADVQMVQRILNEQQRLLYSMEGAIETATASGVSPEDMDAVVDRIDGLHRYCGELMRKHLNDLERTIAVVQARRVRCGAYTTQQQNAN